MAAGFSAEPRSLPSEVAPENWQGPAQPSAQAHSPTKKTPAAQGGTTPAMYSGMATSGRASPGCTRAAATPMTTPSRISGMPRTAARYRPRWPSSGVRADMDIWKAAWARGTLMMKVPNQATIRDTPALERTSISGAAAARATSPSAPPKPGSASSTQTPTRNISPIMMTFMVWLKPTERIPPPERNANRTTAVAATDSGRDRSVTTCRAEANAMVVATEYMGNVSPVMTEPMAFAARPKRSPMMPVTVTTSFSRSGLTSSNAINRICTVSATPYQTAEIPVR